MRTKITEMGRRIRQAGTVITVLAMIACAGGGCASYETPGGPARFHALGITPERVAASTDTSIADRMAIEPLAGFPASIAVIRVQDRGYRSYTSRGQNVGRISIVSGRDVEEDEQFERLTNLPMVRGIAPVNRLILPETVESDVDLRQAAAALHADMLLIYTFDTQFGVDKHMPPLSLITLGLFPSDEARVRSTAMAALLDTRNGYVYGVAEGTASTWQAANAWTRQTAIDQSRRRAERDAFRKLVDEVERMWGGVVADYASEPTSDSSI